MILAAAAVLVVGAGVGAAEKTWYVDDGGGEGINFTKIQDAVNNASEGDTVIVYGGTYKEAIAVNERLILRGIDHPVVDAITIRTDVCVIDGFIVTGSENFGIYVNSNYNTIVNCSIYNNGDDGICLSYSDDNVITNNSVLNNSGNGIHSWHSSHNLLTNNTISLSDGDGIRLENSHYNSIINNSIFGNYGGGVDMMGLSHNTVTNNTIYSNTGDAIAVRGSLYNCIVNNTIYSNGDDGISLSRSWGIEPVVWGSSQNTIRFNVIYLNSQYRVCK
jgi:parallel beta-helix repeat protein